MKSTSLTRTHSSPTPEMILRAEKYARRILKNISDPVCGAREILITAHCRKALEKERLSVNRFFSSIISFR